MFLKQRVFLFSVCHELIKNLFMSFVRHLHNHLKLRKLDHVRNNVIHPENML